MRRIKTNQTNEIKIKNIQGYFEKEVTPFGTGAKIDCPKGYLKKKVIVVVLR
jgi:putative transposon-encoded protein